MRVFQCGLASLGVSSPIHLGPSVTRFNNSRAIFCLSIAYLICYSGSRSQITVLATFAASVFPVRLYIMQAKMQFSEKRSEIPILGLDSLLRQAYNPPPLPRNGERNWPGSLMRNGPQH